MAIPLNNISIGNANFYPWPFVSPPAGLPAIKSLWYHDGYFWAIFYDATYGGNLVKIASGTTTPELVAEIYADDTSYFVPMFNRALASGDVYYTRDGHLWRLHLPTVTVTDLGETPVDSNYRHYVCDPTTGALYTVGLGHTSEILPEDATAAQPIPSFNPGSVVFGLEFDGDRLFAVLAKGATFGTNTIIAEAQRAHGWYCRALAGSMHTEDEPSTDFVTPGYAVRKLRWRSIVVCGPHIYAAHNSNQTYRLTIDTGDIVRVPAMAGGNSLMAFDPDSGVLAIGASTQIRFYN